MDDKKDTALKISKDPRLEKYQEPIDMLSEHRLLIERDYARLMERQNRQVELQARMAEADHRIKKLEATFESEVKTARLERQSAETALRQVEGEVTNRGRSMKNVLNMALASANVPEELWGEFRPTFDASGFLITISRGFKQQQQDQ